jgi:hypothetical protein
MDATFQDASERLRGRLDGPEPQTWRPDDDEAGHPALLIGELVSTDEGRTAWGDRQIAIIRDGEGRLWNVWLLHAVLIGEFVRQQPRIGEHLAIRYEGRVVPQQGSAYEKYRLLVDRQDTAVTWKDAGVSLQPEPAPTPAPAPQAAPVQAPVQTSVFAAAEPEPVAEQTLCEKCGFANGKHAVGCPDGPEDDIPF